MILIEFKNLKILLHMYLMLNFENRDCHKDKFDFSSIKESILFLKPKLWG